MNWTVATLLEATRGELLSGNPATVIRAVSTDTRTLGAGDCFVALPGESHDAHRFIPHAVTLGARAVILSVPLPELAAMARDVAFIRVSDTQYALGELARSHRKKFDIPVVAITGSNGKTSTKEMLSAIFEQTLHIVKNKGNFNNLIGLPLTLLELEPRHQLAVVEMGINVPGEMARLVEIGCPDTGVITNVQPAHLLGLESLDRILEEKTKLWTALADDGLAVVNLDDARLREFSKKLSCRSVTWSLSDPGADVRAEGEPRIRKGTTEFGIRFGPGGDIIQTSLPVMGPHHAANGLAAAAAAWGMGISPAVIAAGLAQYQPVKQRMQAHRLPGGQVLIDDTYNANPASMLAAFQTVALACGGRPFVAVLGEMRELGPDEVMLHRELGRKLASFGPSLVITCGAIGREIGVGAVEAGLPAAACHHAESHSEAASILRARMPADAWVLVKGSRGITMEEVVEEIIDPAEPVSTRK